jgi:hypothetical protein
MNANMVGQAMLITYAGLGVQIDRFDNTDAGIILLFTVPKGSYHKDANNIEMSGKHLASRVKQTLQEMGVFFADCRCKIRDEYWSEDKAKFAKKMAYKDIGYKDWQIK